MNVVNRDLAVQLSKDATQRSYNEDFPAAIELMRASVAIEWQDVRNRCRIGRWLQQSGQYLESLEEFALIVNEVNANIANQFAHQPERVRLGLRAHAYAEACLQARISCVRQKDVDRKKGIDALALAWSQFAMSVQGRDLDAVATRTQQEQRSLELFPSDLLALSAEQCLFDETITLLTK